MVKRVTNNWSSAFGWVTIRKEGYKNVYTILIDKFLGKSHAKYQEADGSITLTWILRGKLWRWEQDGWHSLTSVSKTELFFWKYSEKIYILKIFCPSCFLPYAEILLSLRPLKLSTYVHLLQWNRSRHSLKKTRPVNFVDFNLRSLTFRHRASCI